MLFYFFSSITLRSGLLFSFFFVTNFMLLEMLFKFFFIPLQVEVLTRAGVGSKYLNAAEIRCGRRCVDAVERRLRRARESWRWLDVFNH